MNKIFIIIFIKYIDFNNIFFLNLFLNFKYIKINNFIIKLIDN